MGPQPQPPSLDRRAFLRCIGGGTAGALALGSVPLAATARPAEGALIGRDNDAQRESRAFAVRRDAALLAKHRPRVTHPTNGEEEAYPNKIASYSKGLPHNHLGEVDLAAYRALIHALTTGRKKDFEAIPLGLGRKLTTSCRTSPSTSRARTPTISPCGRPRPSPARRRPRR